MSSHEIKTHEEIADVLKKHPEVLSALSDAVRSAIVGVMSDVAGDLTTYAQGAASAYIAATLTGRADITAEIEHQLSALEYVYRVKIGRERRATIARVVDVAGRLFVSIVAKVL